MKMLNYVLIFYFCFCSNHIDLLFGSTLRLENSPVGGRESNWALE